MKSKGAYIFNTRTEHISAQTVRELYRNNLIKCDDVSLTVIVVPAWAKEKAAKYAISFGRDNYRKDYTIEADEEGIKAWNSYHYPALYNAIVNGEDNFVSYSAKMEWQL